MLYMTDTHTPTQKLREKTVPEKRIQNRKYFKGKS